MSNVNIVYGRLMGDAALVGVLGVNGYSGILTGGCWTRRLKRSKPGWTREAFYDAGQKGQVIRPSAVILDRGDSPHAQRDAIPSAYVQPVPIYLYALATDGGKAALSSARNRIYTLLNGWTFVTANGPVAFVEYVSRQGQLDSEEFTEAVFDVLRFEITSRVANEV